MQRIANAIVATGAVALVTAGSAAAHHPYPGAVVDADWLAAHLDQGDLVVLDIRAGGDGTFATAHIPGAVNAGYAEAGWRVEKDGVVGMTPEVADLERLVAGLGIDNADHVVVVHNGTGASDFGSAARVYWTFNYLGHDAVSILDGGFRGWQQADDRPVRSGDPVTPTPAMFAAAPRPEILIETADVEASLDDPSVLRLDARPAEQYFGQEKAGPARAPGRIPDSVGLDQGLFFTGEGNLRPRGEIASILPLNVLNGEVNTIVSYCNTGHWAATNWFVLSEVLEQDNVRLYDASMTGWTFDAARPLETGKGLLDALGQWVSGYRG